MALPNQEMPDLVETVEAEEGLAETEAVASEVVEEVSVVETAGEIVGETVGETVEASEVAEDMEEEVTRWEEEVTVEMTEESGHTRS